MMAIRLKDDSVLSIVVPHILTLKPKDYKLERLANYKQLNVIVHDMVIGSGSDCAKYIHAEHRHYTSDRNQYYVSRFRWNCKKHFPQLHAGLYAQ